METNTLAVFVHQLYSKLSLKMLQEVVPMVATKSKIKFVTTILKCDKTVKDSIIHYNNLLREQNVYLAYYTDFRVRCLSEDTLDFKISRKTV
eukprot:1937196-Ditylum_brightwellii.AAC.1